MNAEATIGCLERCRAEAFSLNPKGGHPINNAQGFLEDARKSFSLAGKATGLKETERFAAMGRDYLQLAHQAAKINDDAPAPLVWRLT